MEHLVKKLVAVAAKEGAKEKKASDERLGRGILAEMRETSNPELALKLARDRMAREVSAYSGDVEPCWQTSRKAQLVEKWGDISEQLEGPMDDEAVTAVVLELAATAEFPSQEDIEKYSEAMVEPQVGFMIDMPNETNEVVEPGGWPGDEPRPKDQWDLEDPESLGPPGPRTKTLPK